MVDGSCIPRTARFRRDVACFWARWIHQTITRLLPEPARAIVSPRGYLLYGRQGKLFAQRFDAEHNRVVGDPASIGSDLDFRGLSAAFDVSGDTLVWSRADVFPPAKLTWFGRMGQKLNEIGESRPYYQIALAPDGQRVVAEEEDPKTGRSLFLIELTRPIHARLTTGTMQKITRSGRQTAAKSHSTPWTACPRGESISPGARLYSRRQVSGVGRLDSRRALRDCQAECAKHLGGPSRRGSNTDFPG